MHTQREGIAQVAGRILIARRNGEDAGLQQELEFARRFAAQARGCSTLELERLEVLCGAAESLRYADGKQSGAVRLLEHLTGSCELRR
jgi:hypothetical protein